jgi:hypothetical protein
LLDHGTYGSGLIHRSAWKKNSRNFAGTEFSEVPRDALSYPTAPERSLANYFRRATYRVVAYPLTMRPPCSLSIRSRMPPKRRSREVGSRAM